MPLPVSRTVSSTRFIDLAQGDFDASVERELEGVREQIENDFLPHVAVDEDRLGQWQTIHLELQARLLACRAEIARQFCRKSAQVGRLIRSLHPSGLDTGKVEQRIHEFLKPQTITVYDLKLIL